MAPAERMFLRVSATDISGAWGIDVVKKRILIQSHLALRII